MKRKELVQLWMALGLVQADEKEKKEMEDVGNNIFQILVSNSLFQDVRRDEFGHITHCSMHDLMHDLSLSLSNLESKCVVGVMNDDFCQENTNVFFLIERRMMARTLRPFFFFREVEKNVSFQQFKRMRILILERSGIKKIGHSIGGLVHLRYLDLSYTRISVLPESIGKLYHLQTLKLKNCYHLKFPESMRNLISLRYCKSEESIPNNILGHLTSLRTLACNSFDVLRNKGHGIEELRGLNHLSGKLHIFNLENVRRKEDAVMANLSGKKNLNEIEFNWSTNYGVDHRNDKEVLECLQAPGAVKILRIKRFSGDSFPEWVMKMAVNIDGNETPLDKLMSIRLSGCTNCLSLPTLEHLPHLRDLELWFMDKLTFLRSSNATGSMKPLSPSLRSLGLYNMKRLEKWIDGAPNSSKMISPVLEKLVIENCPNIILLDECHPHPLVSLRIWDCTGLVSIKSIQGLTSLVSLDIYLCQSLLEIANLPNECHSLKTLKITDCYKLTSLRLKMFECFAFLNELELGVFSKDLDSFPSLQGIEKLRNHLHTLTLYGVDQWESIPEEIQHLTSVSWLEIDGFGIKELPMWLSNMSSIQRLSFRGCNGLNKETVRRGAPQKAGYVELNYEEC